MKNKIKNITLYTIAFLFLLYIFTNQPTIKTNIHNSLNLFLQKIFPSLFPMFIITELLISLNAPYYLSKLTSKITYHLFKINGSSSYVLIMSLLSGTPSNAIIIQNLLKTNYITPKNATNLLSFTIFSNPLFLYNMLHLTFTHNQTITLILINYLTSLLLGILLRNKNELTPTNITLNSSSLPTSIINAISKSLSTLTMILGTVIFFNLIPTNFQNQTLKLITTSLLEITSALTLLSTSNLSLIPKLFLANFTLSISGLCIQTQIKSIITDTPINYKQYLKNRLIHLLLSNTIILLAVVLTYWSRIF